jgi:RNA polymerase sigma-70 factor (ECF subfamily)
MVRLKEQAAKIINAFMGYGFFKVQQGLCCAHRKVSGLLVPPEAVFHKIRHKFFNFFCEWALRAVFYGWNPSDSGLCSMFFKLFSNNRQLTDQELLLRYQQTRVLDDLAMLYDRHIEMVYAQCLALLKNKDDAQDAVMQIFEQLVEELPRREIQHFAPWIRTMARNFCLMALRRQKGHHNHSLSGPEGEFMENALGLHHEGESMETGAEEDLERLEIALEKLKGNQQRCVALFYLAQMSYQQIATQTGLSLNEVKSHIQNGKRNLALMIRKAREQE